MIELRPETEKNEPAIKSKIQFNRKSLECRTKRIPTNQKQSQPKKCHTLPKKERSKQKCLWFFLCWLVYARRVQFMWSTNEYVEIRSITLSNVISIHTHVRNHTDGTRFVGHRVCNSLIFICFDIIDANYFFLISLFCSLCLPGIANVQNIHTDHRKGIKKRAKSVVMEVNYERRCKNEMLLPYLVHYTRTQIDPMVPTMNAVIDYNRYEHLCVWPLTCNAHFQFVCLIP